MNLLSECLHEFKTPVLIPSTEYACGFLAIKATYFKNRILLPRMGTAELPVFELSVNNNDTFYGWITPSVILTHVPRKYASDV